MSIVRTIYPKSFTLGTITWDKDAGGLISVDIELTATPILDGTGIDQSFSFLAFGNFINNISVRLHDAGVFPVQIGTNGACTAVLSIPATSSPTQATEDVTIDLGTAFVTNVSIGQQRNSTGEEVISLISQPVAYSVPVA